VSRRPAGLYLALLLVTIALGLATRRLPSAFPELIARFGGDALWATMMFWLAALVRRAAATKHLAFCALAICYAVEISQLYRAPWIDDLRSTGVGALVLGQGFLWTDLVSYAVGVAIAAALDAILFRRSSL
jgi:hypothetical protein